MTNFTDEISYPDDNNPAATQPMRAAAPMSTNGGWDLGVSEHAATLVKSERAIATEFGFAHDDGKLFFEAGTHLADVGMDAARAFAAEYAALPTIADASERHTATIAAELRIDRVINPSQWRLNLDGRLYNTSDASKSALVSDTAWSQFTQLQNEIVNAPAATNAPRGNVNAWISQVPATVERKARVRTLDGSREIFAVVSNAKRGYTAYDSDKALRDLARAMPDTRCTIEYDAATTRMRARAVIQAPIDVGAFVGVGRVHRAGVQFTTRDDGMMSLTGQAFIERIRCKNHTLVMEKLGSFRRKHTGTYEQLQAQIATLVGNMPQMIDALKSLWSRAAAEYYLDSETGANLDAPEAIARLVTHGHLSTGGLGNSEAIDAYTNAWRAEECPHTAAGIIMAVERAAHETTWRTRWSTDEIEEQASTLLYQNVYTLAAPIEA